MATAGSIITNIQLQVGDPSGDFLTNSVGLDWLSQAEQRLADKVLSLDEIKDYIIVGNQYRYNLPTNCIIPRSVTYFQSITRVLEGCEPNFWDSLLEGSPFGQGTPEFWSVIRQQLVVGPDAPLSNSATSRASGAIATATTTIGLTAASGAFRSRGFCYVPSTGEVFEYNAISTTELTGVTRGVHNTTPAAIASRATITEVDMQMRYSKMPNELTATTQVPETPAIYQKYLEKYVMYLYFLARGDSSKAEVVYNEFEVMEKDAQASVGRRMLVRHQIRDKRSYMRRWW
jgi:hypothetical protein